MATRRHAPRPRYKEILVADRDEPWAQAVSEALASRGYRSSSAGSADAVRWKIRGRSYDLVVVGSSLGDWALKGLMKEFVAQRALPLFVLVVAPPQEGGGQAARFVPADRVLRRPCRVDEVVEAVRSLLGLPLSGAISGA